VTSLRYEAEVQLARDGEIRSKVILVVVTMRVWGRRVNVVEGNEVHVAL
jgi:hypothetical protein